MLRAAIRGSLMTFVFSLDDTVTGYLCGVDDFHWLVATADTAELMLIHKTAPGRVYIGTGEDLDREADRDRYHKIIGPFREWAEKYLTTTNDGEQPTP
jgi:hypothetical protein